jgi:YbbR domain-containing protein
MIAFLRHIFLDDFWLKLFSTALAVLIWLIVTFASQKEGNSRERVFEAIPVQVVSGSADARGFTAVPDRIEVTVRGDAKTINSLQESDLRVRVDLTGMEAARVMRKTVDVAAPAGVTCLKAAPQEVQVSRGVNVLNEAKPE